MIARANDDAAISGVSRETAAGSKTRNDPALPLRFGVEVNNSGSAWTDEWFNCSTTTLMSWERRNKRSAGFPVRYGHTRALSRGANSAPSVQLWKIHRLRAPACRQYHRFGMASR